MPTYQETLNYLYEALPMYHRIGSAAYKADIANTVRLMERLSHPEQAFRCVHVAGTNGKGSVSHCLASILQESGLKVGLYTSPHLVDFRERIRINGQMIPQEEVTRFVEEHRAFMEELQLSFFEMTVGLAFHYFARQQVDIAVVEVGMGGRLDSTNVVSPLLSIITNIGLDHTQFLGTTLAQIAHEKAGIIKKETPVVIGESHPDTQPVFLQKAESMRAPVMFADKHYHITPLPGDDPALMHFNVEKDGALLYADMVSPLSGWYQQKNLATVMQAAALLQRLGLPLTEQQLRDGIAHVVSGTGLHGRWEVMQREPLVICETAHNEDGIRSMLQKLTELQTSPQSTLRVVYGCVNDKDYRHILPLLPPHALYYVTRPSVPRGLDEHTLHEAFLQQGLQATCHATCALALQQALQEATATDTLLVTGSIFLVADAMAYYHSA